MVMLSPPSAPPSSSNLFCRTAWRISSMHKGSSRRPVMPWLPPSPYVPCVRAGALRVPTAWGAVQVARQGPHSKNVLRPPSPPTTSAHARIHSVLLQAHRRPSVVRTRALRLMNPTGYKHLCASTAPNTSSAMSTATANQSRLHTCRRVSHGRCLNTDTISISTRETISKAPSKQIPCVP